MELLNKQLIKYKTQATSKEEVFNEIGAIAVEQGVAKNKKRVVKGLAKSEKESTTGFFDGQAKHHTKDRKIHKAAAHIILNDNGIECESRDAKPASCFRCLLIHE